MFGIRDKFFRIRSRINPSSFTDFDSEELARDYIAKEDVSAEEFELCCFHKPEVMISVYENKDGKPSGLVIQDPQDPGFTATVAAIVNLK